MIVLTEAEANQVRGLTIIGRALAPVPLIDGTFVLPETCSTDQFHSVHLSFLTGLPTRSVQASEYLYSKTAAQRTAGEDRLVAEYDYDAMWAVGEAVELGFSVLATLGDSHTFNNTLGVDLEEFYTAVASDLLGEDWIGRNGGVNGDSTAQMYSRVADTVENVIVDMAVVYGGGNDQPTTVEASPAPTATVFTVADAGNLAANGWITVGAESAQIDSVVGDEVTLTDALAGGAPAASTAVTPDTTKNLEEIIAYWQAAGVADADIYVLGQHYMNFSSGGDTVDTPSASLATLRSRQQTAATNAGVNFVNLYSYMRGLIVAEQFEQGDFAWHVADGNTHLNAIGEAILADALVAAIGAP